MDPKNPLQIVIMGVSGSGKTTLAALLTQRLGCTWAEADEFHSEASIAKMAAGLPLNDMDRWPWLERLAAWMKARALEQQTSVVTCSALKRSYRDVLRAGSPNTIFIHLEGPRDLILERLSRRRGHFMPPCLLDSQLATLESLNPDERGAILDLNQSPRRLVECVVAHLEQLP